MNAVEIIKKYHNQALLSIMQLPEEYLPEEVSEEFIAMSAINIAKLDGWQDKEKAYKKMFEIEHRRNQEKLGLI